MADDLGVQYTDKKVAQLEKKINQAYKQAGKEIEEKLQTFTKKSAEREKAYLAKVAAGTMSQDDFDKWKQGQVFYGKAWQSQADGITKVLADTNKTATAWINNEKADVFAFNGNYTAFDMERGFGVNFGFDLYNEKTVATLLKDNPKILPKSSLSISKDEKWNMRNIRSQVTQGILQGESIPKIANRLATLVPERNSNQMVLHARTAMTSAQNGGRQQRYKDAEALGIKFKKVWLATLDSRTRPEHQDADGQAVKPNENFIVGGEEMEYPGDPSADPAMVYNCRCTMVTELEDYPSKFDRRAYREWTDENGKEHRESYITKDTTYNEWEKAKLGESKTEYKQIPKTVPKMTEKEYLAWQAKNSTREILEEEFHNKYGVSPDAADRNDRWLDDEGKWLSEKKNEVFDDLWQVQNGYGHCGYIQAADGSKAINTYLRKGEVGNLYSKTQMQETIDSMNRLIESTTLDRDMYVDRCAGINALEHMGINVGGHGKEFRVGHAFCTEGVDNVKLAEEINNNWVGSQIVDKGFMSASVSPENNIFGGSDVTFTIFAKKGTHSFVSDNTMESEIVFSAGTVQKVTGARVVEREATDYEGKKVKRETIEIFLEIITP